MTKEEAIKKIAEEIFNEIMISMKPWFEWLVTNVWSVQCRGDRKRDLYKELWHEPKEKKDDEPLKGQMIIGGDTE